MHSSRKLVEREDSSACHVSMCELSVLATRFNPVNAKFCASLRAEGENGPSEELMVLRPEVPGKVLSPGGCKRVPVGTSGQLLRR